jgi:predicted phosphate transport protein (TIGR00153 family)
VLLFKRNKILIEKINEYLDMGDTLVDTFNQTIIHYLDKGNDSDFEIHLSKAKKIENNADQLLYSIDNFLFKKSLLPEAREDILKLLEKYDDIIDCCVHILRYLYTRNIIIPDFIKNDIKEMIRVSTQCYDQVKLGIQDLLGKRKNIVKYIRTINDYESICDDVQAKIIRNVFQADIDNFDKILLSDLVTIIAKLTDHCEDSADLIAIINIKRVV